MITLIFPGEPIAKARPRFTKRGQVYNKQECLEKGIAWQAKTQAKGKFIEGAINIYMTFNFAGANSGPKHHTKKPDLDNMIKFYMDVLNGVLWKDDVQIVFVQAVKQFQETPSVAITIEEIEDEQKREVKKSAGDRHPPLRLRKPRP